MRFLLPLLLLTSVGCTCATENAFRSIHRKFTAKLTNWVLADNEASKYKDEETEARAELREFRAMAPQVFRIAAELRARGFHWAKENVDFVSYPWVTIARKRGDCDDFMSLWEGVLKYAGKTKKVTVTSTEGGAHAMLLFVPTNGATMYILSNTRVLGQGGVEEWERLVKLFYGEKTRCYLKY